MLWLWYGWRVPGAMMPSAQTPPKSQLIVLSKVIHIAYSDWSVRLIWDGPCISSFLLLISNRSNFVVVVSQWFLVSATWQELCLHMPYHVNVCRFEIFYTHMYVYIHVFLYTCMHAFMHALHVYIYIYIYIYIHTHTHTHMEVNCYLLRQLNHKDVHMWLCSYSSEIFKHAVTVARLLSHI